MIERLLPARARASAGWLALAVAVVVGCWILGNPRSAGPDEPSHMVASAALVRGERDGAPDPARPGYTLFEVPAMVGAPDPACWSTSVGLDPNVPVTCATGAPLTTDEQLVGTSSENYPPWGFLLPGLASFVPAADAYAYLARAMNAVIAVVLVAWSLVVLARVRPVLAVAALLGITPIAWFTFGVVNPSAVAIAGGLALWTGLLAPASARHAPTLAVLGWVAVMLPRRDGPIWAVLIVLGACWLVGRRPGELWSALSSRGRLVVVAAALLAPVTPLWNGERNLNLALAVAPLGLVAVEVVAVRYQRLTTPRARRALLAASAGGVAVVAAVAVSLRPGGFRADTVRLVVAATGEHLRQLVGVLGWLSTPVPLPVVLLQWAVVGGLLTVAYLEARRVALVGVALLAAAVATAWLLELGQGANYGRYWHGRYTMPLAVGLPLVLAWRDRSRRRDGEPLVDRLVPVLAGTAWIVANVAFVAAQQRWAVGVGGTWYPWRWDTWSPPVWPPVLIVVHAVASAAVVAWCARPVPVAATATRREAVAV
jgi:hypothetical protein